MIRAFMPCIAAVVVSPSLALAQAEPVVSDLLQKAIAVRLPRTLDPGSKLGETLNALKGPPGQTNGQVESFGDALMRILKAPKGGGLPMNIPFHADPAGLEAGGSAFGLPAVAKPGAKNVAEAIERLAVQINAVAYVQRDGVVVITSAERARRNLGFAKVGDSRLYLFPVVEPPGGPSTPRGKAASTRLATPVPIPFANETPLNDLLTYLKPNTNLKFVLGKGVAGDSLVQADFTAVPLRSTLALALDGANLMYELTSRGDVLLNKQPSPRPPIKKPGR